MDSEETMEEAAEASKGGCCSVAFRICTVLVLSISSFFFLSFVVGLAAISYGELSSSVSAPASVPSRCKIVSSSVDLRSSKICGIGLLNKNAKQMFHPFERDKFLCRYDYYWASIFKVEYRDHSVGQTRLAFAEAPSKALPLDCRPNFGAAWQTKDNFRVNETYDCWYTLGISKVKLYPDGFFGCQANDPSLRDITRQYAILFTKFLNSWFTGKERTKFWRWETVAGVISGFSTSLITIGVIRVIQAAKSRFPHFFSARKLFRFISTVHLKRACFLVAYFSIVGWFASQYLKMLNFPKVYSS